MIKNNLFIFIMIFKGTIASFKNSFKKYNMFKSLTIAESRLKIQQGLTIVDVREPSEYNEVRIKDSLLIPLKTISKETIHKKLGQTPDIIIYCGSGYRSKVAADILLNEKYPNNIFEIDSGIKGWIQAGEKIISD